MLTSFHELAQGCANATAFEEEALTALGRAIGFEAAFFVRTGEAPTAVALDGGALGRALGSSRYHGELAPLKAAADGGVVVDTRVMGEAAVRRTAYHRHFAAPMGGRHTLLGFLSLRGQPLGALMLGRTGSCFSERDIAVVRASLGEMAVARASYPIANPVAYAHGAPLPRARWRRHVGRDERARVDALSIVDRGDWREMRAGEFVWTRASIAAPARSGWFYVELFHLAAARAARRERALFIGAGGGVAMRQFAEAYPGIAIDVVEIDGRVLQLAREWYALDAVPGVVLHEGDGADFVRRVSARASWDVIVVDAFDELAIPDRLLAPSFFHDVARALAPGGAVAFNTIGPLAGASDVSRVERGLRAELGDVRRVPVLDPEEAFDPSASRNVVLVASLKA